MFLNSLLLSVSVRIFGRCCICDITALEATMNNQILYLKDIIRKKLEAYSLILMFL